MSAAPAMLAPGPGPATAPTEITLVGAGGAYMDTAVIVEWRVAPGQRVAAGDTIAVVETAKAATEVAAPADGIVTELRYRVGDEVPVGAVLALLSGTSTSGDRPAGASPAPPRPAPIAAPAGALPRRLPPGFASPLAKRLARDLGVDLAALTGSGPHRRITRADVLAAARPAPAPAPASAPPPAPAPGPEALPATGYRRAMALHMAQAASVPSFSIALDCEGSALLAARRRIKAEGGRATLNDLLIFVVARVLKRHRRVNAGWAEGGVRFNGAINLGFAVATDLGLVVPVVRDADRYDLEALAAETQRLRLAAEGASLKPAELAGGTFTLSNLGGFGVAAFTAALNPPQAAILAVPAFLPVTRFAEGRLESRPVARLSVTADHRVLDGADVARFLADLGREIAEFEVPPPSG